MNDEELVHQLKENYLAAMGERLSELLDEYIGEPKLADPEGLRAQMELAGVLATVFVEGTKFGIEQVRSAFEIVDTNEALRDLTPDQLAAELLKNEG